MAACFTVPAASHGYRLDGQIARDAITRGMICSKSPSINELGSGDQEYCRGGLPTLDLNLGSSSSCLDPAEGRCRGYDRSGRRRVLPGRAVKVERHHTANGAEEKRCWCQKVGRLRNIGKERSQRILR
jgi:hypothetical protein